MTNPITNRLAARITHLQIERVLRAETIADRMGNVVSRTVEEVLGIASGRRTLDRKLDLVLDALSEIPDKLERLAESDFRKIGVWSNRQSARIFARTIPRRWWRKVNAKVVLVERLEVPVLPELGDSKEPALKTRMSDEEWELWVQKNILPPPSSGVVTEVLQRSTNGVSWRERISGLSKLVDPEKTAASLISGYAEGLNVDEMTRKILPHVEGQVESSARRIARTESLRIANEMQRESYKDLGPLMVGTQVLASLDENTRSHHALRHGRIYYNDGRYPPHDLLPVLPDEPNCRCFDVPVMKPPAELNSDPEVLAAFENANKEIIPDPVVYSQWFAGASEGKQKLAVGTKRLATMKKRLGDTRPPEWTDFIDGQGKLLSPKYLKNENGTDRLLRRGALRQTMDARSDLIRKIRNTGFSDDVPYAATAVKKIPPVKIKPLKAAEEKLLSKHLRKVMTDGEKSSAMSYTGAFFEAVNDHLRGVKKAKHPTSLQILKDLKNVFKKAKGTPRKSKVYRAFTSSDLIADLEKGKSGFTFTDPAYLSTSRAKKVAFEEFGHGKIHMEIIVPKGTKVVPMSEGIGALDFQKEILLDSGTKLKIASATKNRKGVWKVIAEAI